jgi:hypothetical protein
VLCAEVVTNFHTTSLAAFVLGLAAREAGLRNAALAKFDIAQRLFLAFAVEAFHDPVLRLIRFGAGRKLAGLGLLAAVLGIDQFVVTAIDVDVTLVLHICLPFGFKSCPRALKLVTGTDFLTLRPFAGLGAALALEGLLLKKLFLLP